MLLLLVSTCSTTLKQSLPHVQFAAAVAAAAAAAAAQPAAAAVGLSPVQQQQHRYMLLLLLQVQQQACYAVCTPQQRGSTPLQQAANLVL